MTKHKFFLHKFVPGSSYGGSIEEILDKGLITHVVACDYEFVEKCLGITNYSTEFSYELKTSDYDFSPYFDIYVDFEHVSQVAEWHLSL